MLFKYAFFSLFHTNIMYILTPALFIITQMVGASRIIAIDINSDKFMAAQQFGATDFVNSSELPQGVTIQSHIVSMTKWGVDFTYDCTGNVQVGTFFLDTYRPFRLFFYTILVLCFIQVLVTFLFFF
jgi:threonine dehydrogenase-like Zn-dependent dehydrogenase